MNSFKYVDVPHHGSARSNVNNVAAEHRGLAGIPASNYLISHCGNHQNPKKLLYYMCIVLVHVVYTETSSYRALSTMHCTVL